MCGHLMGRTSDFIQLATHLYSLPAIRCLQAAHSIDIQDEHSKNLWDIYMHITADKLYRSETTDLSRFTSST